MNARILVLTATAAVLAGLPARAQLPDSVAGDTSRLAAPRLDQGFTQDTLRALTLPAEIVSYLEALTTSSFDTPYQMGLVATGMVEAALAAEYVSVAGADSLNVRRMTGNMTHVIHAIQPDLVGSGLGLGYGFRRAAEGVRRYAELAASAPGASDLLLYHLPFVTQAASGAIAQSDDAVTLARRIQASTDPEAIQPMLERLAGMVRAMAYGRDADRDGRIGNTPEEMGLAQAAYHLALVRRLEGLPPAPPLPAALPLPEGLVVPGYAVAASPPNGND